MFETDTLQKSIEYAKSSLLRMEFLGLPPTPNNYALLYAYTSGRLPEIKSIIDEAVRKGGLSTEQAKFIFEKHMGMGKEKKVLEDNVKALNEELARVMQIIAEANSGNTQFTQSLDSFSGHLNKPLSVDEFRAAVSKVAQETKAIAVQNAKLQEKLQESSQQMVAMKEDLSKAQKESVTDGLTGVGNRKYFVAELKRLVFEADEQRSPLSLLMIDIDFFKKFNDTHGHLVGDQVLKLVSRTLTENLKGKDVVARYGGEEFVIILPQTKMADANRVGEALRNSVAQKKIIRRDNNQSLGGVTVSIGVTQYHTGEQLSEFVRRADAGLYLAKGAGRNRVVMQDLDAAAIEKISQNKGGVDRFADLDTPRGDDVASA